MYCHVFAPLAMPPGSRASVNMMARPATRASVLTGKLLAEGGGERSAAACVVMRVILGACPTVELSGKPARPYTMRLRPKIAHDVWVRSCFCEMLANDYASTPPYFCGLAELTFPE